jgi:hypothetical protein
MTIRASSSGGGDDGGGSSSSSSKASSESNGQSARTSHAQRARPGQPRLYSHGADERAQLELVRRRHLAVRAATRRTAARHCRSAAKSVRLEQPARPVAQSSWLLTVEKERNTSRHTPAGAPLRSRSTRPQRCQRLAAPRRLAGCSFRVVRGRRPGAEPQQQPCQPAGPAAARGWFRGAAADERPRRARPAGRQLRQSAPHRPRQPREHWSVPGL